MPEDFGSFDRLLQSSLLPEPSTSPPRALPAEVPATGQGDWFTSGVMSGFHGALSEGARALQAGAQLTGATDTAQSLADFAEAQHRHAQSYARADLDANPWSLPGIGYQIARMVPMGAAAMGSAALAAELAPAAAVGAGATALTGAARLAAIEAAKITARRYGLAGASAAMFPSVAGANVERQINETGELTTPGKALVYGVPEAIAQGVVPGLGAKFFGQGFLRGIAHSAAAQGVAGGATEWLTQQLGDPNREFSKRMAEVGHAALSGAGLGAIIGGVHGGFRELVGTPPQDLLKDPNALVAATDQALAPPPPAAPPSPKDLSSKDLWAQLSNVRDQLAVNPQDPVAQKTANALEQELLQRTKAPAAPAGVAPEQASLPLPRVPGKDIQELPLFAQRPEEAPAAPVAAPEPVVPAAAVTPEQLALSLPRVPGKDIQELPLFAQRPAAAPAASVVPTVVAGPNLPPLWDQARNIVEPAPPGAPEQPGAPVPPAGAPVQMPAVPQGGELGRGMEVWRPPAAPELTVPAAPVAPVVDFAKRITSQKSFDSKLAEIKAAPLDVQTDLTQQLISKIIETYGEKKPAGPLRKWAQELNLLDANGKLLEGLNEPLVPPQWETPERAAQREQQAAQSTAALDKLRQTLDETRTKPAPPSADDQLRAQVEAARAENAQLKAEAGVAPVAAPEAPAAPKEFKGRRVLEAIPPDAEFQATLNDPKPLTREEKASLREAGIDVATVEAVKRLRQQQAESQPTPVASDTPTKTESDRVAAFKGIQDEIANRPDLEAKYADKVKDVMKLMLRVERNPGVADTLNTRIDNLRKQLATEALPAEAAASSDLAPSPHAEAVPASTGDLYKRVDAAQKALTALQSKALGGLGTHPGAPTALEADAKWLADIREANGPEELRAVLARDPEADTPANIDADNLRTLPRVSTSQQENIRQYLTTQHEAVLQALRGNDPDSRARVIASRDGLPVTQLDADVADHAQRGVSAADAANHVMEHTPNTEEAEIVAKLKEALPKDVKLVFRDGVTDKEGEYFPKQKTIALYNAADAVKTFIHEMVHAVTHQALEGTSAAAKAIHGIYDQLKDKGNHAGITDAHEMVAEAYANPTYRDYLKSLTVRGTSLWDRLVDTVRGVIGLDPRLYNAFDRIMSHGDDLIKEQRAYPNSEWMGRDSYASVTDKGAGVGAAAADEGGMKLLGEITRGQVLNTRQKARQIWLGWNNGYWLARNRVLNALSPNIPKLIDTMEVEEPRKKQIGRAGVVADQKARAISAEGQEVVKELMALSTSYGYRPGFAMSEYDIHNKPVEVQKYNAVQDLWNKASKIPGAQEAYNTWREALSGNGHMSALLNLQEVGRSITGLPVRDSFRAFDGRGDLTNQPKLRDDHWQQELKGEIQTYKDFNGTLATAKDAVDKKLAAIEFKKDYPEELVEQSKNLKSQIDKLGDAIKLAEKEQTRMFKEPYFHMGRTGDFFVTGKLVTKPGEIDPETGKPGKPVVDPDVLSKFYDHLQNNKITDVAVQQGNEHGTFYTRVETPAQLDALHRVLKDAQKENLLSAEPLARGSIFDPHIFDRVSSTAVRSLIERLRANRPIAPPGTDQAKMDAAHSEQIKDLQRMSLSMAPETSMNRLTAHRNNVQGFNKDMLASQAYAADVSAFSIARRSLAHEISAAEAGVLEDIKKANSNADLDTNTLLGLSDTAAELMRGQRIRQTFVPKGWRDAVRNFTNFLHVGMSPAYFPMQLSSLATTGIPELAKTHGYGRSMAAVMQATPDAFRVLNAIRKSPDWLTAGMTLEALEKDGVDPKLIKTVIGAELRGTLGTYTESVVGRSQVSGQLSKVANAMGVYSDLTPRLIMAIAADRLYSAKPHPELTREQYIDRVVDESQGKYGGVGARQLGRGGMFGASTPLVTQFMSWGAHLTNKIYHEVADVFRDDPQARKEALTWLGGHAAATTMLAGTLGLPLVSVMASAYDRLADLFTNRDDHDLTAAYRGWLANTFGKDMGEIIARGLPRAAGVDFANWGEGEIVPGSASLKIFTEKRKWEDVEKDWFKSMGGPALDQILQTGLAGRDVLNGDYLEGIGRLVPGLVAGPLKAYKLSAQGDFVDSHGQKLPISSPNAAQIMLTALGLKPAKLAEYQEVAREESGLRAMREASSANINQHLRQEWTQAQTSGDWSGFNDWMGAARQWQVEHPGMVPPQVSFSRALSTHMNQLARARATGLPIGVQPRDITGRGMLQYGNFPVQ